MIQTLSHIRVLLLRLGIVILAFTLCRLVFWVFNASHFHDVDFWVFIGGLHFDVTTVFLLNGPIIVFHLIPFPFRTRNGYRLFLKTLFFATNIPLLILNLIDVEYFKFTFKRSTADLLHLMTLGDDMGNLLPQFLLDYWYLPLILVLLIWGMNFLYKKTQRKIERVAHGWRYYTIHSLLFFLGIGLWVLAGRGGIQLKPLSIISASEYAKTDNIPLVLNTPFTIAKTLGKSKLEDVEYFTEAQARLFFDPVKSVGADSTGAKPNVVVLILESFSEEYIGAINGNRKSYTPFLDSLLKESILFESGYANGRKSIEAMPAITSSLPSLMTSPYIQSGYGGNTVTALPKLLEEQGYSTSFFHGGNNGTMGFDAFSDAAGFDRYVGRNEYPYSGHYDGNWGIFDEQFLDFFANELDQEPQPFMSAVFTLSSHHPFTIPDKYEEKFSNGDRPIHNSIRYTDFALEQFFRKAQKMDWFQNTWFVVTADHTTITEDPYYHTRIGGYRVPIAFYHPNIEGEVLPGVAQHTDILPSILHLTGYEKEFLSFGYNLFEDDKRYAFGFLNNTYHIVNERFLLEFDGEKTIAIYDITLDPMLKNNLVENDVELLEMEATLKSVIQQFNSRMNSNKLTVQ
ncbi:LTA synthase family protein [Halocola ammonii]